MTVDELAGLALDVPDASVAERYKSATKKYLVTTSLLDPLLPRWVVWLTSTVSWEGDRRAKNTLSIKVAIEDGLRWVACAPTRQGMFDRARAYATAWSIGLFDGTRTLIESTKDEDAEFGTWRVRFRGPR